MDKTINNRLIEALKARAEMARKPMTEEQKEAFRQKVRNSEFFKKIKAAQEKKLNNKEE